MSPAAFSNNHAKKETYGNMCPLSPLKINKDSHFIKKSPSTLSTSSSTMANGAAATTKPQQRHPVIIYTHSPKVIHTHPRDFMALVQKLTGLSKSKEDQVSTKTPKTEPGNEKEGDHHHDINTNPNKGIMINDDNESTSVITDENGSNSMGDGQVNSCFVPPIFDPPNPGFNNMPLFTPTSYDLLCSTQPYYNFHDPMFFMPTMRNSIASSPSLEGFKDFPDFR